MWELYAFWAFVPFFLELHRQMVGGFGDISLWSFFLIAVGFFGCAVGGILSRRHGSARVALVQLSTSGICCLISPFMVSSPTPVFLLFMVVWGVTVIGDSPQFSALTARTAPRDRVGSALTIVNCIGFSITIASIQLLNLLSTGGYAQYLFLALAPGPVFGILAVRGLAGKM
jgi:MFS family permease